MPPLRPRAGTRQDTDSVRIALAMIRADWQGDTEGWRDLWAVADDPAAVARELTTLCRENLERLGRVAGLSTGEMLHRMAVKTIPRPETGVTGSTVDLSRRAQVGTPR